LSKEHDIEERSEYRYKYFLNNQPDALIIQIYSVIKLHFSGILSAHHQEISTVRLALVSFMQVLTTVSKQSQKGLLTLFGNHRHNLHETYQHRMYSTEHLMMGREDARNM
jgi:hypothetical protein